MNSTWLCLRATDGFVTVAGITQDKWKPLWQAIGREDLASNPEILGDCTGPALQHAYKQALEEWSMQKSKWEVDCELRRASYPGARVKQQKTCTSARSSRRGTCGLRSKWAGGS